MATVQQALRKRLRSNRRQLSPAQRKAITLHIIRHITHSAVFMSAKNIACYLPLVRDGEVDVRAVIETIWARKKNCYLPVLRHIGGCERLWFGHYTPDTEFVLNRFGILEPVPSAGRPLLKGAQLDMVLAPLVGFDLAGHRIGMGGGFYDRSFSYLRHRKHWRKPRLIGIAYECQKVPSINRNQWDVALDGVITEAGLYRLGKNK